MRIIKSVVVIFLIFIISATSTTVAFAHSGRTDSQGGHYDRSTGDYHYHHGHPAHDHPDGVCPYAVNSKSQNSDKDEPGSFVKIVGCIFGALFFGYIFGNIPTAVIMITFIAFTMKNKETYDKYSDKIFNICTAVFTTIGVIVVFIGLLNEVY